MRGVVTPEPILNGTWSDPRNFVQDITVAGAVAVAKAGAADGITNEEILDMAELPMSKNTARDFKKWFVKIAIGKLSL